MADGKPKYMQPAGATDQAAGRAVTAQCARCSYQIGEFLNKWDRITASHCLPALVGSSQITGLDKAGAPKPADYGSELDGCTIQPLQCHRCRDLVAFVCVATPSVKSVFSDRDFFNLHKINLVSDLTGEIVMPVYDVRAEHTSDNEPPLVDRPASSSLDHERPSQALFEADEEAIREKNKGIPWAEFHARWARKTMRELSPASFGRRLLEIESDKYGRLQDSKPASRHSPSQAPALNGVLPLPKALQASFSHTRPDTVPVHLGSMSIRPGGDGIERQRQDIDRIDSTLARLAEDIQGLKQTMADLQQIRSPHATHKGEASSLDLLSESITHMSAKVGEVDGLKVEVQLMKHRMRNLEAGPTGSPSQLSNTAAPSIPQQPGSRLSMRSDSSYQSPFPPISHGLSQTAGTSSTVVAESEKAVSGWVSMNGPKRKSPLADSGDDSSKKQRLSEESSYKSEAIGRYGVNTQAADSQASWRPYDERRARGGHTSRGRSGRSKRIDPADLGTPDWEREDWNPSQVDRDGYYRPLAPISPSGRDRGQIIRRGSSNPASFQIHDQHLRDKDKKTRLKPVRNEDGILIRKDGRPDKRSISSPQNLRKVHAKRLEMDKERLSVDRSSRGSPSSPLVMSDTLPSAESPDNRSILNQTNVPVAPNSTIAQDRHKGIIKKVFPKGLEAQAREASPASRHFTPANGDHTAKPSQEAGAEAMEIDSDAPDSTPAAGTTDQTPTPPDSTYGEVEPSSKNAKPLQAAGDSETHPGDEPSEQTATAGSENYSSIVPSTASIST